MINATERKQMVAGMTLTARYKGETYECTVVEGEEGKLRYRLADGREFKSPSAAGSAVMGGVACNGWRFWSLAGEPQEAPTTKSAPVAEEQLGDEPEVEAKPQPKAPAKKHGCEACGKSFMSAKQLAHHRANADRLCTAA